MSNARRIADLLDSSGDVLGTNLDNVTTYSVGDGGLTTNDFTDADHTKLNAIEASATADQTGAEIKTAYEAEANAYTDTKDTKLSGIATSANNYSHPSGAGNSHIPTGGSVDQLLTNTASGTGTWQDAPVSLPSQTGNANKQLTTDGSTASWADTSITLDAPSITGTLSVDSGGTVSHTISNWSDDVSYTITPTNCTVGAVNSSGVFVVTHTSGTPSYTIVATTDSLGLADSSVVTKNIVLSVAMTAPSLNAPADSDDATAVTYTISSINANATKVIFDAQSSNFTYGSVGSGSGSKVGNTVEITGWSGTSVTVTLTYTTAATYSNRAKVQSTNAAYTDSAYSSTDSIIISSSYAFQGSSYGFMSGGYNGSAFSTNIEKYAFSSNTTASDHGDLAVARSHVAGQSSATDGFNTCGYSSGWNFNNIIDKFSLTSNTTAADHGDINTNVAVSAGSSSETHGFVSGGEASGGSNISVIDKFAFSSNTTAANHGSLTSSRRGPTGTSSSTDGFTNGGYSGGNINNIDKHSFASNTTTSDHGDLSVSRRYPGGCSSSTQGFICGGEISSGTDTIDKFDFSSNTTATDHGDLQSAKYGLGCSSSTTHGFVSGRNNSIDKFAYSSNTTAADHGDVTYIPSFPAGHQV